MDSFGFDFAGGDLLDLGSLGSWGGTPLDSSPSNSNLPFSVGTPTGVQSLGGEGGFTNLHVGDDFGFIDSPKSLGNTNLSTSLPASTSVTSSAASTTASNPQVTSSKSEDFFSSTIDQDNGDPTTSDSQDPKLKSEELSVKEGDSDKTTTTTTGEDSTGLGSFVPGSSTNNSSGNDLSNTFQSKVSTPDTSNPSSKPPTSSSGTATPPSSTNASSARPHIDTTTSTGMSVQTSGMPQQSHPSQLQQLQPQPRYGANLNQANMMIGGPPPSTGYGIGMNVGPGQPMMNGQPQYMQPPPQPYRPTPSTYNEEMMRVKSMMMQHPDLIPPPLEVLRISMAQGQGMPGMMGTGANPNAYLQRPNSMVNRPNYGAYGAPNPNIMMTGQPGQPPMMDPRMRVMQQQQMNPQRTSMSPQSRVPGGPEGIPVAWQSESDLPLRRKMIGKIVSLLQQRKPDAPAEWIRRLPDMARRLEDSLYRTAKNRDEYGDFSSLKTRLQHLAVTMGARAQHKSGVTNPRPGAPPIANGPGAGPNMMGPGGVSGMPMNVGMPNGMPQGVAPMPMGVNGMPYGNPSNRMTPQQAQMLQQQQQLQMQMQTRQFSPQQMQQYQAAQRHRHFQMQQQAQLQRQNSSQQFQQQQAAAAAGLQRQNSLQRQHSGGQPGQQPPNQQQMQMQQQMHQQMQQRQQNPNYMQQVQGVPGSNAGQQGAQAQLQRRNSVSTGNPTASTSGNTNTSTNVNPNANISRGPSTELSGGLDSNDFLDLDLTQTFMGNDLDSALNSNDLGGSDQTNSTGMKRTQQQMAAEANAAAFKRMKGSGPNPAQRGSSPHSPQKSGGQSKTPSMSAVDAK